MPCHLLGVCALMRAIEATWARGRGDNGFVKRWFVRCRSGSRVRWASVVLGLSVVGVLLATGIAGRAEPPRVERSLTTDTRQAADWEQLEETIQRHRELVRMCGPLSAARVIQGWGLRLKDGFWDEARALLTEAGVPLRQVVDWCREANPSARGVLFVGERSLEQLRQLTLPCVVVVNEGHHCLVLESVAADGGVVRVWDPSDLQAKPMPVPQLLEMWNGAAIVSERRASEPQRVAREERRWLVAGGCGLVAQSVVAWGWRTGRWKPGAWKARQRPS